MYAKFQCRFGSTEDVLWHFTLAGCFAYIFSYRIISPDFRLVGLFIQYVTISVRELVR